MRIELEKDLEVAVAKSKYSAYLCANCDQRSAYI